MLVGLIVIRDVGLAVEPPVEGATVFGFDVLKSGFTVAGDTVIVLPTAPGECSRQTMVEKLGKVRGGQRN